MKDCGAAGLHAVQDTDVQVPMLRSTQDDRATLDVRIEGLLSVDDRLRHSAPSDQSSKQSVHAIRGELLQPGPYATDESPTRGKTPSRSLRGGKCSHEQVGVEAFRIDRLQHRVAPLELTGSEQLIHAREEHVNRAVRVVPRHGGVHISEPTQCETRFDSFSNNGSFFGPLRFVQDLFKQAQAAPGIPGGGKCSRDSQATPHPDAERG
jgi:hypothetical protein